MLNFFKKLISRLKQKNAETQENIDLNLILSQIAEAEEDQPPEPGRKIHSFLYKHLEIRLDLDITETYRITVSDGPDRLYSFSVFCQSGDKEQLGKAYKEIAQYLNSGRNLKNLPDNDLLKGFYYGE